MDLEPKLGARSFISNSWRILTFLLDFSKSQSFNGISKIVFDLFFQWREQHVEFTREIHNI